DTSRRQTSQFCTEGAEERAQRAAVVFEHGGHRRHAGDHEADVHFHDAEVFVSGNEEQVAGGGEERQTS
ncbi:MAG: hypothetical protein Q9224_004218, partial [Gallowayella concinna]